MGSMKWWKFQVFCEMCYYWNEQSWWWEQMTKAANLKSQRVWLSATSQLPLQQQWRKIECQHPSRERIYLCWNSSHRARNLWTEEMPNFSFYKAACCTSTIRGWGDTALGLITWHSRASGCKSCGIVPALGLCHYPTYHCHWHSSHFQYHDTKNCHQLVCFQVSREPQRETWYRLSSRRPRVGATPRAGAWWQLC